jgi:hypothetical protein
MQPQMPPDVESATRRAQFAQAARKPPRRSAERRALDLRLRLTGALAGLVTLAAMLALRGVTGQESLVELVAETVLQVMPIAVFEFFLRLLQGFAKPLLLTSVILGFVWVFAGIGRLVDGPAANISRGRRLLKVLWLILGLWIPAALFAVAITTFVPSVSLSNGSLLGLAFSLLLIATVYAVAFYASFPLVVTALARASTRVDARARAVTTRGKLA